MDRLTRLMWRLALVVCAAGVVCFFLVYRPSGVVDGVSIFRDFAFQALANRFVPIAALTAVVATVAARLLERPGRSAGADNLRGPKVAALVELEGVGDGLGGGVRGGRR